MDNNDNRVEDFPIFNGLDKMAKIVFIAIMLVCGIFSCVNDKQKDNDTSVEPQIVTQPINDTSVEPQIVTQPINDMVIIHESAHYCVYMAVMAQYGLTPSPIKLTIIPEGGTAGHFEANNYGNRHTEIATYLAGFATEIVFGGQKPEAIFKKIKAKNFLDYRRASEVAANPDMEYAHFLKTIEWVQQEKPRIIETARQLKAEKTIYF